MSGLGLAPSLVSITAVPSHRCITPLTRPRLTVVYLCSFFLFRRPFSPSSWYVFWIGLAMLHMPGTRALANCLLTPRTRLRLCFVSPYCFWTFINKLTFNLFIHKVVREARLVRPLPPTFQSQHLSFRITRPPLYHVCLVVPTVQYLHSRAFPVLKMSCNTLLQRLHCTPDIDFTRYQTDDTIDECLLVFGVNGIKFAVLLHLLLSLLNDIRARNAHMIIPESFY